LSALADLQFGYRLTQFDFYYRGEGERLQRWLIAHVRQCGRASVQVTHSMPIVSPVETVEGAPA